MVILKQLAESYYKLKTHISMQPGPMPPTSHLKYFCPFQLLPIFSSAGQTDAYEWQHCNILLCIFFYVLIFFFIYVRNPCIIHAFLTEKDIFNLYIYIYMITIDASFPYLYGNPIPDFSVLSGFFPSFTQIYQISFLVAILHFSRHIKHMTWLILYFLVNNFYL